MKARISRQGLLNAAIAIAQHFSSSKRTYALAICIVISLAFAALFAIKVSSATYTLQLMTSRFTATVAGEPSLVSFDMPAGFLVRSIDGLSQLTYAGKPIGDEAPISVTFDPPQPALSAFNLQAGSTLTVAIFVAQGGIITIRPNSHPYTFRLNATGGKVLVTGRNGHTKSLLATDGPIILDGETWPRAGAATIYMTPANVQSTCHVDYDPSFAAPNVEHVVVDAIRFARTAETLESTTTSSTIISGVLRFPTIDREIALDRGDALDLSVEQSALNFIRMLPCGISLQLKGVAERVGVGSVGATKDVRPTYLEVAMNDKDFGFVLSALISMWGFLWGLRELVLPEKET